MHVWKNKKSQRIDFYVVYISQILSLVFVISVMFYRLADNREEWTVTLIIWWIVSVLYVWNMLLVIWKHIHNVVFHAVFLGLIFYFVGFIFLSVQKYTLNIQYKSVWPEEVWSYVDFLFKKELRLISIISGSFVVFLLCYLMSLCCNVCSPLYANCTLYSVSMCTALYPYYWCESLPVWWIILFESTINVGNVNPEYVSGA